MNVYRFFFSILVIVVAIASFATLAIVKKSSQSVLDFPFELKEHNLQGISPVWRATVILDPVHYKKSNLDKLFLWYSRRHPEKDSKLELTVYTDRENLLRHEQDPERLVHRPYKESSYPASVDSKRAMPYDAICWRQGDGLLARNGDNLWYSYIPDLSSPYKIQRVVLRGRDYFATKKVLESWEASTAEFKINVSAYDLVNVEPASTYYTFSSGTRAKNFDDMDSVLTIRRNSQIPIPQGNVKLIGDKIGYMFMGWIYAVTTDGGKTWSKWDAEQDLPNWQCCNQDLIQGVIVESNGFGSMSLNLDKTTILKTENYGKTWK